MNKTSCTNTKIHHFNLNLENKMNLRNSNIDQISIAISFAPSEYQVIDEVSFMQKRKHQVLEAFHRIPSESAINDDINILMMYQNRFCNALGLLGLQPAAVYTLYVRDASGVHRCLVTKTGNTSAIMFKNVLYTGECIHEHNITLYTGVKEQGSIGEYTIPRILN